MELQQFVTELRAAILGAIESNEEYIKNFACPEVCPEMISHCQGKILACKGILDKIDELLEV